MYSKLPKKLPALDRPDLDDADIRAIVGDMLEERVWWEQLCPPRQPTPDDAYWPEHTEPRRSDPVDQDQSNPVDEDQEDEDSGSVEQVDLASNSGSEQSDQPTSPTSPVPSNSGSDHNSPAAPTIPPVSFIPFLFLRQKLPTL
jgi:hypothetical protein